MPKHAGVRSNAGSDVEQDRVCAHVTAERTGILRRAARVGAGLLLAAYAGIGHAALGGPAQEFGSDAITVESAAPAPASNFSIRDTTLATGTRVREYISAGGIVFALTWAGPVLPDLKALLGPYFDTMVAESARRPRAGRSHIGVNTSGVVINSSGHMRALEGSAWIAAQFPAGFTADDVR